MHKCGILEHFLVSAARSTITCAWPHSPWLCWLSISLLLLFLEPCLDLLSSVHAPVSLGHECCYFFLIIALSLHFRITFTDKSSLMSFLMQPSPRNLLAEGTEICPRHFLILKIIHCWDGNRLNCILFTQTTLFSYVDKHMYKHMQMKHKAWFICPGLWSTLAALFAKPTFNTISRTYSSDLWKESVFTKPRYQEFTGHLVKTQYLSVCR